MSTPHDAPRPLCALALACASVLACATATTATTTATGTAGAVAPAERVVMTDPLSGAAMVPGQISKVPTGGEFTERGWRALGRQDRLLFQVAEDAGFEGALEVDVTGLDWEPANAGGEKIHFINMFTNPNGDHHCEDGGTPKDALWTLRLGRDERRKPRYGQSFKVLWASRGAKRCEGSDYHELVAKVPEGFVWDKDRTHRFKVTWSRQARRLAVFVDDRLFFETPWRNQETPLRHIFLGRAGDYAALIGPTFSNLRLVASPAPR